MAKEELARFASLRAEYKLRELTDEEEGTGADHLPPGVFGFTYSPAEEDFPFFKSREIRTYECHKLEDGSVVLLGFLTGTDKEAFESGREEASIQLFGEPKDDANELVRVPMARVIGHVEHSQRGGKGLELKVKATT